MATQSFNMLGEVTEYFDGNEKQNLLLIEKN